MPTLSKVIPIVSALALTLLAGCSHRAYYVAGPPPPPVYNVVPPLVQIADSNGFRDGQHDGARDLYQREQYRPTWDRRYAQTPGYDGRLGPYPVYRDHYRLAYLRGYNNGFRYAAATQ